MTIRRATDADLDACQAIVRGLPDHFTGDVPEKIARDLGGHGAWVLTDDDDALVAFAIVARRPTRAAEVLWMAVRTDRRRRGLGASLLEHVLASLRAEGMALVEAKTLDASADYEPYVGTRSFWERHGFVQIGTIDPLPGWRPGNPAAIFVCALGTTH